MVIKVIRIECPDPLFHILLCVHSSLPDALLMPCSVFQLDLITDLLGTPSLEDMKTACEPARQHIIRAPHKPPTLTALYTLSNQATHEAVDLLCRMLVMDPVSSRCTQHYTCRVMFSIS